MNDPVALGRCERTMSRLVAPPASPLSDSVVGLRLPTEADIATLAAYVAQPGGLDGNWLPVAPGASEERLRWIVADWLRGWVHGASFNGPALLLTLLDGPAPDVDVPAFVGQVGFDTRVDGVVELVYGVAPAWRGRDLATRATVLATRWLLRERAVRVVELRIGRTHRESQRVAEKAGYRCAESVHDVVGLTGETYDDLRYVLSLPPGA